MRVGPFPISVACEGFDSPTEPHPHCAVTRAVQLREGAMRLTAQRGPTSGFSSSTRDRNRKTPHDEACGASFYSVACEGFEPPNAKQSDLQSDPFGHLGNMPRHFRPYVST
jgi:hypothetical protein